MKTIDWRKILTGGAIALGGALLTYLSQVATGIDFGPVWTPVITAGLSFAINALRKVAEAYKAKG